MMQSLNCPNCSGMVEISEIPGSRISCPTCHALLVQTEDSLVKPPEPAVVAGSPTAEPSGTQNEVENRVEFIREMVQAGNKIVAMKALRDVFKLDKNKAQELVDAMARGEGVDIRFLQPILQVAQSSRALDPILMQKLVDLVRKGEKIEAIKLFRQETGAGLKDAMDGIDVLQENLSASPGELLAQTGLDLL